MSKAPQTLPDLDDDDAFKSALRPLAAAVLPGSRVTVTPEDQSTGAPVVRSATKPGAVRVQTLGKTDSRTSVLSDNRSSKPPDIRQSATPDNRISAARELERIEQIRGPKKRFEYLIPERVGTALAEDAAARGLSAATRLLEILRDSGYPVLPEDMIDLRKLPKR